MKARPRWAAIQEHRLVVPLLGLLGVVLLVGAAVPQQSTLPPLDYAHWRASQEPWSLWFEALGVTAMARSAWVPGAAAPLLLLLGTCTVRRSWTLVRQWRRGTLPSGWSRRLGSVVFHAGIFLGVAASILSAGTRFTGHAELAPGARLVDAPERFLATESGWWVTGGTGLTLRLDDVGLATWPDGSLSEQRAVVTALRGSDEVVARLDLSRGQPADLAGFSLTLGSRTGPSVLLAGQTESSGTRRSGWVHLPEWPGQQSTSTVLQLPGSSLRLQTTLSETRPGQFETAVLRLRPVADGTPSDNGEWVLRLGETASIGSVQLEFVAADAWTSVTLVRDPFALWALGAFVLSLAGLARAVVQ